MGMDLASGHGQFRVNYFEWPHLLELAYEHGWEPAGTQAPAFGFDDGTVETVSNWNGTYFSNDHQVVKVEDAANLADGLERALKSFPGSGWVVASTSEFIERDDCEIMYPMDRPDRISGTVCLCSECRQYVRDFIEFCRRGSFHIG